MLYLGAASGTTVSHVSDIVGEVIYRTNNDRLVLFMQWSFQKEVEEI